MSLHLTKLMTTLTNTQSIFKFPWLILQMFFTGGLCKPGFYPVPYITLVDIFIKSLSFSNAIFIYDVKLLSRLNQLSCEIACVFRFVLIIQREKSFRLFLSALSFL